MADALIFLHELQIMHRDLKGDNLLLDGNQQVLKIADFGTAVRMKHNDDFSRQFCGTVPFMAPQVGIMVELLQHMKKNWLIFLGHPWFELWGEMRYIQFGMLYDRDGNRSSTMEWSIQCQLPHLQGKKFHTCSRFLWYPTCLKYRKSKHFLKYFVPSNFSICPILKFLGCLDEWIMLYQRNFDAVVISLLISVTMCTLMILTSIIVFLLDRYV